MTLKIELKPREKVIIGECVLTNGSRRAEFSIDGTVAVLREKDIMTPEQANSPARRIYLAIQLMYTASNPAAYHNTYFTLVRDITQAAPSMWPILERINNRILTGEVYKALKEAKKLIAYEAELIEHASSR
jgi:flagellar protein FlbT